MIQIIISSSFFCKSAEHTQVPAALGSKQPPRASLTLQVGGVTRRVKRRLPAHLLPATSSSSACFSRMQAPGPGLRCRVSTSCSPWSCATGSKGRIHKGPRLRPLLDHTPTQSPVHSGPHLAAQSFFSSNPGHGSFFLALHWLHACGAGPPVPLHASLVRPLLGCSSSEALSSHSFWPSQFARSCALWLSSLAPVRCWLPGALPNSLAPELPSKASLPDSRRRWPLPVRARLALTSLSATFCTQLVLCKRHV